MERIIIPFPAPDAETLNVVVWRDTVGAMAAGTAADAWISAALGLCARLPKHAQRPRRAHYVMAGGT